MKIRNNLKKERLKKQLTQRELAQKIYITERHYRRFEKGELLPNLKTAIRIARVLKTTVEELFPLERPNLEGIEASKNKTR